MTSPQLRIVLVDSDHFQRMSIEKNLSCLGYHRVAPVSSLSELMTLMDNAVGVFDLLVINEHLAHVEGVRLDQLLCEYSCVQHSLVYKGAELQSVPDVHTLYSDCHFTASGVPDRPVLAQVMSRIEMHVASHAYNSSVCAMR